MKFLNLFTRKFDADINITTKKSKRKSKDNKPLIIIEVNDTSFYLTDELAVEQIKKQPLDVLAYLLTRERFKALENKKRIQINNQYFDVDSLNLIALEQRGKKEGY